MMPEVGTGVSINPADMKHEMEKVAGMSMEAAYEWGKNKNRFEDKWAHYSPRIQTPGLFGSLETASKSVGAGSLASFTKHLAWHWLAKCQTNSTLSGVAKMFADIQKAVTASIHTDLDDRIKVASRYSFIESDETKRQSLYLPASVSSALVMYANGVGIPSDYFFVVGVGWSLAQSKSELFKVRSDRYYRPEFDKLMELAKVRHSSFKEAMLILAYRDLEAKGKVDTITLNGVRVLTP